MFVRETGEKRGKSWGKSGNLLPLAFTHQGSETPVLITPLPAGGQRL
jgi:hypothetical protein